MTSRQPCGHEGLRALGFYPVHSWAGLRPRAFSMPWNCFWMMENRKVTSGPVVQV